jgi:diaminopimelate epimerase
MLIELGYDNSGKFTIGTRAGTVTAIVEEQDVHFQDVAIRMGHPGMDFAQVEIAVTTERGSYIGAPVFMPNPHCVSIVEDVATVGDLIAAPTVHPIDIFPNRTNVEFIAERGVAHIIMRTHERGVGETLSCGSGACAAASMWAVRNRFDAPWSIQVDVLGGTVHVDCDDLGVLTLRGPAHVVANGIVHGDIWTR